MSKVVVKSSSGYFISGSGFVGTQKTATVFPSVDAASCTLKCAASMGITASAEVLPELKSYAVGYIRASDLNTDGSVKMNTKNPSRRRFATIEEARAHGSRYFVRKAKGSTVVGSAGHIGYYVIVTNDPVNAAVNPKTGLTNKL